MPGVQRIIQLSRVIAVSTAACESSFSTLKRVLTPHRILMLHSRKADLILISYERELAGSMTDAEPPENDSILTTETTQITVAEERFD